MESPGPGSRPAGRTTRRPLPWVSSILYIAVLVAGLYYEVTGLCGDGAGPVRAVGFAGVLSFLFALEVVERRRFGLRTPLGLGIALLALRMVLIEVVASLDCSSLSRALYLLIPFTAYFSLGRWASYGLSALYVGALVTKLAQIPGWYTSQEHLSDLLMFCIGLVFAISMAAVAADEEASRSRAERLLGDLEVSHRQLRTYAEQVAELAAATERNRLARDIHDSLGHHLTVIAVQLEKATAFRDRDSAAADQAMTDARRSARHALEDVRQSVGALRSGGAFSLTASLQALVERLSDGRLAIDVHVAGEESGFAEPVLMTLFRAAQEGLTNAHRHADASRVAVMVSLDEGGATLRVEDNGRGFPVAEPPGQPRGGLTGFGLQGMRERLALVGGSMRVDSDPGQGTRITVTIPRPPTTDGTNDGQGAMTGAAR